MSPGRSSRARALVLCAIVLAGSGIVPATTASAASKIELLRAPSGIAAAPSAALPFLAGGFEGLDGARTGVFPPDVQIAVGPSHVVATVNVFMGVFGKDGSFVSQRPIHEVLGLSGFGLIDPNVLYDSASGRFFLAAFGPGQIVVGVSTSSDPTAPWKAWTFPKSGSYDFPQIGVSKDLFVVNVKFVSAAGGSIELLVFDKSDLVAGVGSPRRETLSLPRYLSPAQMLTASDVMYLVRNDTLWTLAGKPGALSLTSQSMPGAFTSTDVVPVLQPGGVELDMLGRRAQLQWANGVLWVATMRPCDWDGDSRTRTCAHLDAVVTGEGAPRLVQSFDVGSPGSYYFFPALTIDGAGNVVVVAGRTSPDEPASVVVFGRRATDPPNTARPTTLLRSGTGTYGCRGARNIWGDFFGAAPDPADATTVWVAGEYANVTGGTCAQSYRQWGTYVAQFNWIGACRSTAAPTTTAYLPNVTKTLGGPAGFQTPFIVQNTGSSSTDLEVSFYRFGDGSLVACRKVTALAPGASFAHVPNTDVDLPDNAQLSVVVRSFGAPIVAVVNQHKGTSQADAYSGASKGATTVYLPNVVRRFFGFHSPAIIQNLGTTTATVTATYRSFEGSAPTRTFARTIAPGQSQVIDPNSDDPIVGAPGLVDGKQYAAILESTQPISVVLNTHADAAFYSANGVASGAATVYGSYAVKGANGARVSTIVVQNLASSSISPSLTFTPLGGGTSQTFTSPSPIGGGAAWAFDPRFTSGAASTNPSALCTTASATCLGSGEYSFTAQASGAIVAMVNVIGPDSAMGYTASHTPAAKYYLPNVLANYGGWNTPIFVQSVAATSATLTWTPFGGGVPIAQNVTLTPGAAVRIDPLTVPGLPPGGQYAVTVAANGAVAAIVMELHAGGGDTAMIYGGFAAP